MRKLTAILMSLLLAFCLTACGNGQQPADENLLEPEKTEESEEQSSADETETASSAEESASDTENVEGSENVGGKTLVVYYSASGNTEEVANYIATATGGDVFELEPSVPYTDADLDWTNEDSRVCREHENEEERNVELVSSTVPDWDSYETVFIGYPNWWADLPQVLYSFLDEYDFSGKTIVPFNVHNGSHFSRTIETIQELEPQATVITDGFTVNEKDVPDAADDVSSWLSEIGY